MKKHIPLVINALFVVFLYLGFYNDIQGAKNVAVFYIWLTIVIGMLYLFVPKNEKNKTNAIKIPLPIIFVIQAFVLFTLIWNAWWWTAGLYFFAIALMHAKNDKEKVELEKTPEFQPDDIV